MDPKIRLLEEESRLLAEPDNLTNIPMLIDNDTNDGLFVDISMSADDSLPTDYFLSTEKLFQPITDESVPPVTDKPFLPAPKIKAKYKRHIKVFDFVTHVPKTTKSVINSLQKISREITDQMFNIKRPGIFSPKPRHIVVQLVSSDLSFFVADFNKQNDYKIDACIKHLNHQPYDFGIVLNPIPAGIGFEPETISKFNLPIFGVTDDYYCLDFMSSIPDKVGAASRLNWSRGSTSVTSYSKYKIIFVRFEKIITEPTFTFLTWLKDLITNSVCTDKIVIVSEKMPYVFFDNNNKSEVTCMTEFFNILSGTNSEILFVTGNNDWYLNGMQTWSLEDHTVIAINVISVGTVSSIGAVARSDNVQYYQSICQTKFLKGGFAVFNNSCTEGYVSINLDTIVNNKYEAVPNCWLETSAFYQFIGIVDKMYATYNKIVVMDKCIEPKIMRIIQKNLLNTTVENRNSKQILADPIKPHQSPWDFITNEMLNPETCAQILAMFREEEPDIYVQYVELVHSFERGAAIFMQLHTYVLEHNCLVRYAQHVMRTETQFLSFPRLVMKKNFLQKINLSKESLKVLIDKFREMYHNTIIYQATRMDTAQ